MNNYTLYDEIGHGKYSVVYKGRKRHTISYVAIKSTEKTRRDRIMNEVSIGSKLKHNNVVRFHHWHETRNHLWIISEYCAGGDLLKLLKQDGRLPEVQVRSFGREIMSGLHHVHGNGVVHCDIKPANLLCNEAGVIKIAGFGQAKLTMELEQKASGGQVYQGTPQYMAPELFQDGGAYSIASDLWAFGCVLHEMFAGRSPFHCSSMQQLRQAVLEDPAPALPGHPAELQAVVDGLLGKEPHERLSWPSLISHSFWSNPVGADAGEANATKRSPNLQEFAPRSRLDETTRAIGVQLAAAPAGGHAGKAAEEPSQHHNGYPATVAPAPASTGSRHRAASSPGTQQCKAWRGGHRSRPLS
mmetsp:Transcript_76374/g.181638  ORF Transcript_76374/g.181638 Transcript_76374/m.181638 type:complete len:357 (-) Transcript_76374:27-1097(-)